MQERPENDGRGGTSAAPHQMRVTRGRNRTRTGWRLDEGAARRGTAGGRGRPCSSSRGTSCRRPVLHTCRRRRRALNCRAPARGVEPAAEDDVDLALVQRRGRSRPGRPCRSAFTSLASFTRTIVQVAPDGVLVLEQVAGAVHRPVIAGERNAEAVAAGHGECRRGVAVRRRAVGRAARDLPSGRPAARWSGSLLRNTILLFALGAPPGFLISSFFPTMS